MSYNVHPELKSLSANLKRLDIGNYLFTKDFELELEENILDDFWNYAENTRNEKESLVSKLGGIDYEKNVEIFVIGLDIICRDYYNNYISFEETSKKFTLFFKVCFCYYLSKTTKSNDYSKLINILEQNDFIEKITLDEIKKLIENKSQNILLNEKMRVEVSNVNNILNKFKNKSSYSQLENIKKYQIFISSTFIDLKEERQAAVEAILKKGHIPAGMELFTAGDKSQWEIIKKWIDESDIYLLILGGRYGSIDESTGISYTEMEYNYAIEKGKPFFALSLSNEILDKKPVEIIKDFDLKNPKYIAFKEKITKKMCAFPKNNDQIKNEINHSLDTLISENKDKMLGWIKGTI